MFVGFGEYGKVDVILGGQYGSEGKGAASAALYAEFNQRNKFYDVIATNAGVQSGHTSVHDGIKRVLFHLPTFGVLSGAHIYLNAGSVIDPEVLLNEIADNNIEDDQLTIHPNAAIVTQGCRDAEARADSAQTKIASTRKGVGEAISRKVLRSGKVARDEPRLRKYVERIDLNNLLTANCSVLLEVPQGLSLSLNSPFYPHCTSRDCTVGQAMSDAGIHPEFMGKVMLIMRTYPIRVGNITGVDGEELGYSGGVYSDQQEIDWAYLGQPAEITTVTKRVRRVFTWSNRQLEDAIALTRPHLVYLTFCDYIKRTWTSDQGVIVPDSDPFLTFVRGIADASLKAKLGRFPELLFQFGPSTKDVTDQIAGIDYANEYQRRVHTRRRG